MDQPSPFPLFYTCSATLDDLDNKILWYRLWVIGPTFLEVIFHKPLLTYDSGVQCLQCFLLEKKVEHVYCTHRERF